MNRRLVLARVLVTGGAGYIGSHTVTALLLAGHQPVVFDNLSTGFAIDFSAMTNQASSGLPKRPVPFIQGDVRNRLSLSKVMRDHKIEAVLHFAAKLNVAESVSLPLDYYENNTLGVLNLAQACLENKIDKVVFSSTAAVYGNGLNAQAAQPNEIFSKTISESSPLAPLNPYGHSKLMSEQILADSERAFGLRAIVLRYFNVAGAAENGCNGQRTRDAFHLIHLASQAACGLRPSLTVFGTDYPTPDGTCLRDYLHVEDLADAHVLALQHLLDGGKSDVFNCGYSQGVSVLEVISTMKKISGVDFATSLGERRVGDAISLVANAQRIKATLNWIPKRNDLELICRTALNWERAKLALKRPA